MDALDAEISIAAGEQALQALITFVRERAGKLEAHEAEKGLFKRLLPMGLAAMTRYFAQRGTGEVGPAITRADGVVLARESKLRRRDDFSRFGTFAVARTCDRMPGAPGIFPLDAQVNLPERCDAYVLQEWMTLFAVEHPFKESASWFAPLFDLDIAESVLMEVAKEAPEDDEGFSPQRLVPPAETAGEFLVVSFDGKGVPMIKAEAIKLTAKLGPGEKRQRKQAALVGVSSTVEAKPRAPEARAERLVDPEAARARQRREGTRAKAPRAREGRRVASLVRPKPAVMELLKADAEHRDPPHHQPVVLRLDGARCRWRLAPQLCKPWQRVTCVLDSRLVGGDLWAAANAWFGEASQAGQPWVQQQLTEMLRGRVGDVIGGRRPILTPPRRRQSVRQTRAQVITCLHHHRRWMQYDQYLAMGTPVGTGVVESAGGAVVTPRLEGEGQRWSLAGAEAILAWRSLKKSHDHDLRDDWRFQAHQVRLRLYGRQPKYRPTERLTRVASLDSKRSRSAAYATWEAQSRHAPHQWPSSGFNACRWVRATSLEGFYRASLR